MNETSRDDAEPPEWPDGENRWTVGTASTEVTPSEPMWMAGYAARDAPAEGTETPLRATAVAVADRTGRELVVVSVEVISIPRALRLAVVEAVATSYDLGPESVLLSATHTHCGPVLGDVRARMYGTGGAGVDAATVYRTRLADTLVDLVGAARADARAAALWYSHARCGFAMNRRLPVEDGVAHVPNPDGPVDHDVPALVATVEDDPVAVLFGYACHATTLRIDRYCGDWPGYAVDALAERYPDATVAFLPGCGGDQNPYPRRSLAHARQHGQSMANAVTTAIDAESARRPVRGPLRLAYEEPTLPFEGPPTAAELERMRDADDPFLSRHGALLSEELAREGEIRTNYPYPMQAVGFGSDLTLLALAGEVLVEYALELKRTLPGPLWVSAYANDSFTYVPTAQVLAEGGYEGGEVTKFRRYPGRLEPSVEARVLRQATALAHRVRR